MIDWMYILWVSPVIAFLIALAIGVAFVLLDRFNNILNYYGRAIDAEQKLRDAFLRIKSLEYELEVIRDKSKFVNTKNDQP
jgi:hypothetical protein